jgi:hypothetical protein
MDQGEVGVAAAAPPLGLQKHMFLDVGRRVHVHTASLYQA